MVCRASNPITSADGYSKQCRRFESIPKQLNGPDAREWSQVRSAECGVSGVDFQLNLRSETVEQSFLVEPLCLSLEISLRKALEKMREENEAAVLICRDGKLVGIFTERDALKMMANGASFDVPLS